jgi:hypothetical protein
MTPCSTDIMASVTISGLTRKTTTPAPLARPTTTPMMRAMTATTGMRVGSPAMMPLERTVTRPMSMPTERSMPAVRMTKVCPSETMPRTATWRSTASRFASVAKLGTATIPQRTVTPSATKTP